MTNSQDDYDGDLGSCHLCGMDPVEYERVPIGVTEVDMCGECYEEFRARTDPT